MPSTPLPSHFTPRLPLAVAFSGGADSTALLLACWQRWPQEVCAIHVHHGLQSAADAFADFCARFCHPRGIALHTVHCDARHRPGQSPEDAARLARYAALEQGAQALGEQLGRPVVSMALAHHADDQVETFLLAASRGAGLPGLAAMPRQWQRPGSALQWHRPLLEVPGAQLRQWLREQGQDWVEDASNTDPAFTRNRIRAEVLPALERALSGFQRTFARSSAHAAQAQALLEEIAAQDWQAMQARPALRDLQALSPARQANVLRHWLALQGTTAQAAQLQELQRQIAACTTRGHRIELKVGRGQVVRQGDVLHWQASE